MNRLLCLLLVGILSSVVVAENIVVAAESIDELHMLIPGGEGGGWDTMARETGRGLENQGLVQTITYENRSGGGGARAIIQMVENPERFKQTLMVQSFPLILRYLTSVLPYSFRDLRPVMVLATEYQVLVVNADSPYKNLQDFLNDVKNSPRDMPIVGGSSFGSLDHVTMLMLAKEFDIPASGVRYVEADGGAHALSLLEGGWAKALVTGLGEVLASYQRGEIRILAVTAGTRLDDYPDIPTAGEQGVNVIFQNWRGFFTTRQQSPELVESYRKALLALNDSDSWKQTRKKYGWQSYVKEGAEFELFLEQQESELKSLLEQLAIVNRAR